MKLLHLFIGHPREDCKETDFHSVQCTSCGMMIVFPKCSAEEYTRLLSEGTTTAKEALKKKRIKEY